MKIEQLEKQLEQIRDRKNVIKKDIQLIKKNSGKFENVIGSDWWYLNSYLGNAWNNGTQISVELTDKSHMYLSYMEKNNDFTLPPTKPIKISKESFSCEFTGSVTESLQATLHLIGYKNGQKVSFYKIPLNETVNFEVDPKQFDCFRMAVKLTGSGNFSIDAITLDETNIPGFADVQPSVNHRAVSQQVTRVSPTLNIDRLYKTQLEINQSDLIIPSMFSKLLSKEAGGVVSQMRDSQYSYMKYKNNGPLFQNPIEKIIDIKNDCYYEFGFSAIASEETNVELVLLGFSSNESKATEVHLISNNEGCQKRFKEETDNVQILFRLKGAGKIDALKVGINEVNRQANYRESFDLKEEKWFTPNSIPIELQEVEQGLKISSDLKGTKPAYLSYNVTNNSFSKVPDNSIFEVHPKCLYEISISGEQAGEGIIQPILITYTDQAKSEIISLKMNELNEIHFKEDIKKCRFSFKVIGNVQLTLEKVVVEEYEVFERDEKVDWANPKEPELLGLLPKKPLSAVKMAAIFDEFTSNCFAEECELIKFTPENWHETLTANPPDFLMVESAWKGNDGSWTKKVQYKDRESVKELRELIQWCRANNIPTVFWNKEDPVHYDHFINTAKLFDFVYTTDSNMIPVYKEACGHSEVGYLRFAAQPSIHNPLTIGERINGISFAGSYYKKHEERSVDMLKIFNTAIQYNLNIFDRNFEKVKEGLLPNNRFPEHLESYIQGSLKYYEIDRAYKGFRASININTVKNSPTMFARRVFESLASGTPVISNYSEGLEKLFGDIVLTSENEKEIEIAIKQLFEDEKEYRSIVQKGIRRVMKDHTYAHRLLKIVENIGLPFEPVSDSVTVVATAVDYDSANKVLDNFAAQNYKNKHLLLLTDGTIEGLTNPDDSSIALMAVDEFTNSYQNILEFINTTYVGVMNSEEEYEETYLLDLMLAAKFAPWEVIGYRKDDSLVYEQTDTIDLSKSIFKLDLFALYSSIEVIDMLTNQVNTDQFRKRGSRTLGVPLPL